MSASVSWVRRIGNPVEPRVGWEPSPELYLQCSLQSISLTGFPGAEFVLPGCPSCSLPPLSLYPTCVSRHPFFTCCGQRLLVVFRPHSKERPPHAAVMPSDVHFSSALYQDSTLNMSSPPSLPPVPSLPPPRPPSSSFSSSSLFPPPLSSPSFTLPFFLLFLSLLRSYL